VKALSTNTRGQSALRAVGWLAATVLAVFIAAPFTPVTGIIANKSAELWSDLACGGGQALAEAERKNAEALGLRQMMSESAKEALRLYGKAYSCGNPDAGIMVATAHCDGLGTPKNDVRARELLLQIEDAFPHKVARVNGARRHCGL